VVVVSKHGTPFNESVTVLPEFRADNKLASVAAKTGSRPLYLDTPQKRRRWSSPKELARTTERCCNKAASAGPWPVPDCLEGRVGPVRAFEETGSASAHAVAPASSLRCQVGTVGDLPHLIYAGFIRAQGPDGCSATSIGGAFSARLVLTRLLS
jgi:hypothetical protein